MTDLDKLVQAGAVSACGDLILNRKVVGHLRSDGFILTEDGAAYLSVDDVVVKSETPKAAVAVDQVVEVDKVDAPTDYVAGAGLEVRRKPGRPKKV